MVEILAQYLTRLVRVGIVTAYIIFKNNKKLFTSCITNILLLWSVCFSSLLVWSFQVYIFSAHILYDVNLLMQYSKFVKPAFDDFILPTKKYADIIIPRGGDNHVAIDLIVQHICTKLGQHDLCKIYPNLYVIHSTFQVSHLTKSNILLTTKQDLWLSQNIFFFLQIRGMHTLIRDSQTTKHDFVFYSDRLIRLVGLLKLIQMVEQSFLSSFPLFELFLTFIRL